MARGGLTGVPRHVRAGLHVPLGASPQEMKALAAARRENAPVQRSTVPLTAELVEAFVLHYLHSKYDDPAPTPSFHREIWRNDCSPDPQVLSIAPRGHAKSTAHTEAYGLAAMLFRQRDFGVIISNTYPQSVEFLEDMKKELTENDELIEDFGVKKLVRDREDDIIVLFEDGAKFRLMARGAEQKIRGLKWNKRRPNFFLFDDLEDDEQVASQERRKKFMRWFQNALLPAGSKDALFRGTGTILHFDSLLENLAKTDTPENRLAGTGWRTLRFRAHRSFDDFSEILWPEMYDEARLRKIRQDHIDQGNEDGYSQEYLNYPIAEGQGFFRVEDLQPMLPEHRLLPLRKYCAWDFAISEKQRADYTVCIVVGVDEVGRIFVVDVRRGRLASDKIIEEMFSVQEAHGCECHYAEAGVIEKAIGPYLYKRMAEEQRYFNVEPILAVTDKQSRAASWRARTRARKVYYDHSASWWPALLEEMRRFPRGEHDDQVDPQSLLGLQLEGLQPSLTHSELEQEAYEEEFGLVLHNTGRSTRTGY